MKKNLMYDCLYDYLNELDEILVGFGSVDSLFKCMWNQYSCDTNIKQKDFEVYEDVIRIIERLASEHLQALQEVSENLFQVYQDLRKVGAIS